MRIIALVICILCGCVDTYLIRKRKHIIVNAQSACVSDINNIILDSVSLGISIMAVLVNVLALFT